MNTLVKLVIVGAGLVITTACSTTIRSVSSTHTTSTGVYVGYWEGDCKPILGCGVGDGKIQLCRLNADNSLTCEEQQDVSRLLARRAE